MYLLRKIAQGIPTNINNYFYLPALGQNSFGKLYIDKEGYYWGSTPSTGNNASAGFSFSDHSIFIAWFARNAGGKLFKSSNEDEYRPF